MGEEALYINHDDGGAKFTMGDHTTRLDPEGCLQLAIDLIRWCGYDSDFSESIRLIRKHVDDVPHISDLPPLANQV